MKYPRIGRNKTKPKNTSAKCRCGAIGKYRVEIEVSYFRGDDLVFWACADHRKDMTFLMEGADNG